MSNRYRTSFYCHNCHNNFSANTSNPILFNSNTSPGVITQTSSPELISCILCDSTFVEFTGQNLEQFLGNNISNPFNVTRVLDNTNIDESSSNDSINSDDVPELVTYNSRNIDPNLNTNIMETEIPILSTLSSSFSALSNGTNNSAVPTSIVTNSDSTSNIQPRVIRAYVVVQRQPTTTSSNNITSAISNSTSNFTSRFPENDTHVMYNHNSNSNSNPVTYTTNNDDFYTEDVPELVYPEQRESSQATTINDPSYVSPTLSNNHTNITTHIRNTNNVTTSDSAIHSTLTNNNNGNGNGNGNVRNMSTSHRRARTNQRNTPVRRNYVDDNDSIPPLAGGSDSESDMSYSNRERVPRLSRNSDSGSDDDNDLPPLAGDSDSSSNEREIVNNRRRGGRINHVNIHESVNSINNHVTPLYDDSDVNQSPSSTQFTQSSLTNTAESINSNNMSDISSSNNTGYISENMLQRIIPHNLNHHMSIQQTDEPSRRHMNHHHFRTSHTTASRRVLLRSESMIPSSIHRISNIHTTNINHHVTQNNTTINSNSNRSSNTAHNRHRRMTVRPPTPPPPLISSPHNDTPETNSNNLTTSNNLTSISPTNTDINTTTNINTFLNRNSTRTAIRVISNGQNTNTTHPAIRNIMNYVNSEIGHGRIANTARVIRIGSVGSPSGNATFNDLGTVNLENFDILGNATGVLMGNPSDDMLEHLLHHILMNENSYANSQPASDEVINALVRETYTTEHELFDSVDISQRTCSISQDEFQLGEVIVKLPCLHRFKETEVVRWLRMKNTCPVCRTQVTNNINTNTNTNTTSNVNIS